MRDHVERCQEIEVRLFPAMQRRLDWSGSVLRAVEGARRARLLADKLVARDVRATGASWDCSTTRAGRARKSGYGSRIGSWKMTTRKVIITCAVTGAIHTPSMSPYLPVTPEEITAAAIGAAEAGAAIIHLHARDPVTGKPDQTPEAFGRFLPQIKQASNAVVNITTGGAPYMRVEERVKPALQFKPEVASLNMGSMNIGLFHMLDRYKEFKHSWEPEGLENSRDGVFRNTFRDIEFVLRSCADNDTRFEFECYDIGHLYSLSHFLDRGLVKPPLFVQSVFGLLGGIGPHPEDVLHMRRTADRLFGDGYRWSVLGAGRNQMNIASIAAAMGGNVRVGLEDSLWDGPGKLAELNAAQVKRVRQIVEGLGMSAATPDEAREILSLKGGDRVNF